MALISRVLGTVVRPLGTQLRSTAHTGLFVLFLVFAFIINIRPVLARSHSYDNNSVPPVGSKLEQEVVNAIKVRAHSLANASNNPAERFDSPYNYFTDNGEKTLTKFSDPRHFFTHLASRNLTTGRKGARGSISRSAFLGNNTSPNVQKIIIFSQNKGAQSDAQVEPKKKSKQDGDKMKTSVGTQTPEKLPEEDIEKEKETFEDTNKSSEVTSDKTEDHGRETAKDRKDSEKEDSPEQVKISPSSVVFGDEEKKEKTSKEKSVVDEESTVAQKPEEEEKDKESVEVATKDKKDVSPKENEKDTNKVDKKAEKDTAADVEEKVDGDSKKVSDKDLKAAKEQEKIEGKEEQQKEEKEEELEVEKEKGKDKDKNVDKVEKDKPEKKQKEHVDAEEPGKEKKQSDSKKKDKKKTEETEDAPSKSVGEGEPKTDEKSEDTLETYSQFTQRVSAEKKNDVATNGHGTNGHSKGSKVKGKNYASPDCGAKLVTANPEASHTSKVIHPNKDEYMLNKCRDKIWFVIEMCESIRPQKFDIANFELFSNLPKDIQVLGSHRYPSRDWTSFGWFKGQEGNRGLQSFRIETEDFFKYIKVEVTSNYGSEFYCPISTFQIYGLSEFEVIDTIEDPTEDTDDDNDSFIDPVEETGGKKTKEEGKQSVIPTVLKNMFSGVLDVIKRGYRPSSSSNDPGENCYSLHPKFAVENDVCPMAGSLNYILSCYKMEYEALMQQPFVSSTVKNSSFCRQLALTMCTEPEVNDSIVYDTTCNNSYVCVMLSPKHVLAMCYMQDPQIMDKGISCESPSTHLENYSATSDLLPSTEVPAYVKNAVINTSSITRADSTDKNRSGAEDFPSRKGTPEVIKDRKLPTEQNIVEKKNDSADALDPESLVTESGKSPKELKAISNGAKDKPAKEGDQEPTIRTIEPEENVEVEGSGFGPIDITEEELPPIPPEEPTTTSAPVPSPPSTASQPTEPKVSNTPTNKESVVVRLSNKIKALEYNMSISSQYLEELSRRYKRQMEEMQRQFNLTIAALNDTSWQAYERDQHHQRDIEKLEEQLANVSSILQKLVDERETLAHTVVEQHVLLMVVEVIVLCMVFTVCSRRRNNYMNNSGYPQVRRNQTPSEESSGSNLEQDPNCPSSDTQGRVRVRRRSVDSITSERTSRLRQRRPSEEALNISGTYQDLLIIEPAIPILMDSISDRKKKRKSSNGTLKRSKSNASIVDKSSSSRRAKRIEKLNMSSAGVLFCGDEVDSKAAGPPPPAVSPVYAPDSLDLCGLMHDSLCSDEGSLFYGHAEDPCSSHTRSMISTLGLKENFIIDGDPVSKRHSIACFNCDNAQKKGSKLAKSPSVCSTSEKTKSSQEKTKKVKKLKKARVKDSANLYDDSSQTQNTFPDYNKDYYYPKPNGLTYSSPIETYDSYYYNGHNSVHFSEDTNEHCDHTYSCATDVPVNGGYSNGISTNVSDRYRHNEYSFNSHDTLSTSEKKKLSPRVKSKVKLRSDNWEWYSSQNVGGSSSETVSTCSDSSGKSRKLKKDELISHEKSEEKKGKKKKKAKSKSPVLLEEENVLDVEAGT